ncbi:DNA topoisomerase I [Pyrolobus fumarii 1A]|uniref:DNA topoisomerase n=1 Tax=Pyrolobus fumarii (strain DSM 11204 / 1A) TaxID=694429 RepID=G0EDJ5_PYRF1|nr:DNA topoisomerase I [Pyrolobus fumarii]AEM39799.1 DNA topoisomerase I [Pyrolobus fumarii 1A]
MVAGGCRPPRGYGLIIAEKPKAAAKIAEALGGRYARRCTAYGVPYWVLRVDGRLFVVAPAAGHLYGLYTDERGFPVFTYRWVPLDVAEGAKHARKFLALLATLCRDASIYINACDYDVEGSVIGYMIIRNLGDVRRAYRMKFSALTPTDIRRAFRRLEPLDWPMIEAGLARHELDWLWGINVSRALMEAVKLVTGKKVVLSAGRVQSPTLVEAAKREARRRLHVPYPRFNVQVWLAGREGRLKLTIASREKLIEAKRIADRVAARGYAFVSSVAGRREYVKPPPAFNLSDLQMEAARLYGYSPAFTQEIAEQLYLDGLISYPRTNSQKLPHTLDFRGILEGLASIPAYTQLVKRLLLETRGVLRPVQGPKEDPAHPAIHPTGAVPRRKLNRAEERIYDLIVRRFLAAFSKPAVVERVTATLDFGVVRVNVSGTRVLEEGWYVYYPFSRPKDDIPRVSRGERLRVERVVVETVYTEPPEAYTKAKLVRWMEEVGIGTEATRARIVETLFDRGYLRLSGGYVTVTDLGFAVAEVLEKFFPKLTSVAMTREFERLLEDIRRGIRRRAEVVEEAKRVLSLLLEDYKKRAMRDAGLMLAKSLRLVEAERPCVICGRESVDGRLCRFHLEALEALKRGFVEWRRRLGGIGWEEYLERVASLRETGMWVRDVAKYLLETGLAP